MPSPILILAITISFFVDVLRQHFLIPNLFRDYYYVFSASMGFETSIFLWQEKQAALINLCSMVLSILIVTYLAAAAATTYISSIWHCKCYEGWSILYKVIHHLDFYDRIEIKFLYLNLTQSKLQMEEEGLLK